MRILEQGVTIGGGMLVCPRCGGDYLHQSDVMVFNCGEDAEKAHLTGVIKDGTGAIVTVANVDNNSSLNPSPRRHGLLIDFWCESCDVEQKPDGTYVENRSEIRLAIYQHKGCTLMDWRQS